MVAQKGSKPGVQAVDTAFAIVETLRDLGGATTTEVAEELDLAKSTAHDHLSTLHDREYLVKEGTSYRLGLRFLDHGMAASGNRRVRVAARPELEDLAADAGEVAWLYVEEHGRAVVLDRVASDRAVGAVGRVGMRSPVHAPAAGKAILAALPDERVEAIIDRRGLPAVTGETVTDRTDLFDRLARIRERGFAHNDGETTEGLRAVGSAIATDGRVYGALSVAGPANRIREERFRETLPHRVRGATNAIELIISETADR